MKRSLSSIFFLCCVHLLHPQEYSGNITPVTEDGIYAIALSPEVHSASLTRTDAIRILDGEHHEIPYWSYTDTASGDSPRFTPFPITSKNGVAGEQSSIIVANEKGKAIDHMILKIATAKISKTYSISGSDDGKQWFGLVDREYLGRLSAPGKALVEKRFSFPLNSYSYLRWDFDDEKTLPVNVREAGIYEKADKTKTPDLIELQGARLETTQDTARKKTIIQVRFTEPQQINTITFTTEGPGLFLRKTHIRVQRNREVKKRTETYTETLKTLELDSQKENRFSGLHIFEKEFTVEIENGDNLPLKNIGIRFFQVPVYLVAELRAGKEYRIAVNPDFPSPDYDIGHFKTLFRDDLPQTEVGALKKVPLEETGTPNLPFWKTRAFLWFCILTAAVFISYFSWRLLGDIKK